MASPQWHCQSPLSPPAGGRRIHCQVPHRWQLDCHHPPRQRNHLPLRGEQRMPQISLHQHAGHDTLVMIQTVRQRYKGFTKRKVKDTIAAHKAQAMLCHPTDAQFVEMVRNKTIKTAPSNHPHHQCPLHLQSNHRRSAQEDCPPQTRASRGSIGVYLGRFPSPPQIFGDDYQCNVP